MNPTEISNEAREAVKAILELEATARLHGRVLQHVGYAGTLTIIVSELLNTATKELREANHRANALIGNQADENDRINSKLQVENKELREQRDEAVALMSLAKTLNQKQREQLAEALKWKDEDPRMLREQIRVADVAYNTLREQVDKLKGDCEAWSNSYHELEKERDQLREKLSAYTFNPELEGVFAANKRLHAENAALRQQVHDLCHDKHTTGPVTPEEFCDGCEAFQQKLFGRSPIAELKAKLPAVREALRKGMDMATSCSIHVGHNDTEGQEFYKRIHDSIEKALQLLGP